MAQYNLHRSPLGDIKRAELKQHVADIRDTSQRTANTYIKMLIDEKVIKVDGKAIIEGENYGFFC